MNQEKIFESNDTIMTFDHDKKAYGMHRKLDMGQHDALASKIHAEKENDRWNRSQSTNDGLMREHEPVGQLIPSFFEAWVMKTLGSMPTENGKEMNTMRIIATRPDIVAAYFKSEEGKIFCRNPQYVSQITK